jgi:hypothetical protein
VLAGVSAACVGVVSTEHTATVLLLLQYSYLCIVTERASHVRQAAHVLSSSSCGREVLSSYSSISGRSVLAFRCSCITNT